jgi:hypothetical protein
MNRNLAKGAAAVAAVAVLVFGAAAISGANKSSASNTTAFRGGMPPQGSGANGTGTPPQGFDGTAPQGGRPGFGTPVSDAAAKKAAKAATAKYPGQVEHVMQLPDGSYVVHVITSSGEVHVLVSKAFKVIGKDTFGGPGGGHFRGRFPPGAGPAPDQGQGQVPSAPSAPSTSDSRT